MRKIIVGAILAGTIAFGGAVACGSQNGYSDNGQYAEVEYGYYNGPTWIAYSTPHVVYVTHSYYVQHSTLFSNPRHIAVPSGVRVGVSRTGTTYGQRTTTTTRTSSSTTRGTRSTIGGTARTTRTTTIVGSSRSGRR